MKANGLNVWLKMQKCHFAKLRGFSVVRVCLSASLLLCGIFVFGFSVGNNLNLVLVLFCLNQVGIIRSAGYQVRVVSEHFLQDFC